MQSFLFLVGGLVVGAIAGWFARGTKSAPAASAVPEPRATSARTSSAPTSSAPSAADVPGSEVAAVPAAETQHVSQEPATEEPATEKPATEEPAAEEPAAHEPVAHEPVAHADAFSAEEPAEKPADEPAWFDESSTPGTPTPIVEPEPITEPIAISEAKPEPVPAAVAPEPVAVSTAPVVPEQAGPVVPEQAGPVVPEQAAAFIPAQATAPAAPAVENHEIGPVLTHEPDDLTRITGIGPKMAMALAAGGITTYEQLASTDVVTLKATITAAGMRLAPTIGSWPERARALVAAK